MKTTNTELAKGDFVKVTGKLKADFYLSREGKPTGTLLIIAFEAAKIAKPQPQPTQAKAKGDQDPPPEAAHRNVPAPDWQD